MSYKLFLDDERLPQQVKWVPMPVGPWVIVRSYNEFVETINERGLPEYISFDHDLSFEDQNIGGKPAGEYKEKTGKHCADWLVNFCLDNNLKCPKFGVHSMNPVGAKSIRCLLQDFTISQE